jgi:hypothetical protein
MDERTRYRNDVYGWSQDQAEALRDLRDRPDLPNALDLDHVIEEIESVGSSELASVQSYLRLVFVHLIKLALSPNPEPRSHWREEVLGYHAEFLTRYAPSMRQHIELDLVWRRAVRQAEAALAEHGDKPGRLGPGCAFTLDDVLAEELDLAALTARIEPDQPSTLP